MKVRQSHLFRLVGFVLILYFTYISAQTDKKNSQPSNSNKSSISGDLRLHQFQSKVFGNKRTIRVFLPPGYDENNQKKRYAVLYLNDGQNLFDVSSSVFNPMEWQVDETVLRLINEKKIQPLIVVGIDNGGRRVRDNEYLPYEDKFLNPPLPNPEGYKYTEFLTQEVMPFIEQRYRVRKGAENTGLGGSSYGALISLYTIIRKPDIFGKVLLESPSFYVSEAQILKEAEKLRKLPQKVYLGVGTNEGGRAQCKSGDWNEEAVQDVLKLKKILQDKGFGDKQLKVVVEDCAVHNEDAWARRFPEALKFLYK